MTYKWLSSGQNPPRILEFYTVTKTNKNTSVGRPIVNGSRGPTECISSFVDSLSQPIAQNQESYIKDTTRFINFINNTPLPVWVVLVTSTFVHLTLTFRSLAEKRSSLFWTLLKNYPCRSDKRLFPKWSAMAPGSYYVVYFDRGHQSFWNFNSTIRVHIVRAKSYVNSLLNLSCVPLRVSVNKLNFVQSG